MKAIHHISYVSACAAMAAFSVSACCQHSSPDKKSDPIGTRGIGTWNQMAIVENVGGTAQPYLKLHLAIAISSTDMSSCDTYLNDLKNKKTDLRYLIYKHDPSDARYKCAPSFVIADELFQATDLSTFPWSIRTYVDTNANGTGYFLEFEFRYPLKDIGTAQQVQSDLAANNPNSQADLKTLLNAYVKDYAARLVLGFETDCPQP